jgi:uncharacterized coiled-coil protein SlyX
MKPVLKLCAIMLLATTTLIAQTSTSATAKKSKPAAVTAADVQALKDAIAAQQSAISTQEQQIRALQDELRHRDQAVQQAQTAATDASSKADAAQAQASQQQQTVGELKTAVTDLRSTVGNTVVSLQDAQKNMSESPLALHVKGITITPGGFLAAEFVRRSRALAADVNTPLNSLTMPGASQSNISEFFGSGRQSRISMLAEGRLATAKLSGYVEADFLSAAATSNNNQSNSYALRQRQAWGQAAMDNGWSITGGQMWSLITETKHGMDNRTEALPMTIDAQYTVGFSWARQYGVRVVKNFGNKAWVGVSIENPQATVTTHGNGANFLVGSGGAGGGLYNPAASTSCTTTLSTSSTGTTTASTFCSPVSTYSFNPSPDIIAKLAFEPGFGHYEIFGIYSRFRDRIFPCGETATTAPCGTAIGPSAQGAFNSSADGGGVGANARWSFYNKHIDFGLHGLAGDGVGRYGDATLADASVRGNGTLDLIRSYQGLGTLEWHGPKLDIYLNGGAEYDGRTASFDPVTGKVVGYGARSFSNSGCFTETIPKDGTGFFPGSLSSCTADTRALIEGTAGFWYKIYDGSKDKVNRGRLQWGAQYSYITRNTWSGKGLEPHGIDGMVFTSFRYYLP